MYYVTKGGGPHVKYNVTKGGCTMYRCYWFLSPDVITCSALSPGGGATNVVHPSHVKPFYRLQHGRGY